MSDKERGIDWREVAYMLAWHLPEDLSPYVERTHRNIGDSLQGAGLGATYLAVADLLAEVCEQRRRQREHDALVAAEGR